MKDSDLAKLHQLHLMIMKKIHEICEKHHIRYFLFFGTLLGAVRHQGFIPWDDDVDIGMFREDYDKFAEVCRKENTAPFLLEKENVAKGTCAQFYLPDTKIDFYDRHFHICVDICCFDVLPQTPLIRFIHFRTLFLFRTSYSLKNNEHINLPTLLGKIMFPIIYFLSWFPEHILINFAASFLRLYSQINRNGAYLTYSFLEPRIMKNPSLFTVKFSEHLLLQKFEDSLFYIPASYHSLLTALYDNYLVPPPDVICQNSADWEARNKTRSGHDFTIDFGPYA